MSDPKSHYRDAIVSMTRALKRLVDEDRRYKLEAYIFVQNALSYAQEHLKMGSGPPLEIQGPDPEVTETTRHVTGRELCEALRLYALDQFGLMSKLVLDNWGIRSTSDFGEIVFNLIGIGRLRKSETDRREDFNEVYDFNEAFCDKFQIQLKRNVS